MSTDLSMSVNSPISATVLTTDRPSNGGTCAALLHRDLMPGETFGSWFEAVASLHGCTRETLAQALLTGLRARLPRGPIDWDLHPPRALLRALKSRVAPDLARRLHRAIPAPHADLLRCFERGAYCPKCRGSAAGGDDPFAGLWAWSVICEPHQHLLIESATYLKRRVAPRPTLAPLPCGCASDSPLPAYLANDYRILPDLNDTWHWLAQLQRVFRPPDRKVHERCPPDNPVEFDENLLRKILRDLVMVTACDVQGLTLLEWYLPRWRRWVWRDDNGRPEAFPEVWSPRADVRLRQEAMCLAGRMWHWLNGEHPFHTHWDAGVYLALRRIRAHSGYGRLLGEVLSSWPAAYRIKWVRAFGRTWHVAARPQRSLHPSQNQPRRQDPRHVLRKQCPPLSGTRQRSLPPCNRGRRHAECHKRRTDLLHCTKAFDK